MCGSREETGKCDVLHGRDKVGAREETKMEKPACIRTLVLPSILRGAKLKKIGSFVIYD